MKKNSHIYKLNPILEDGVLRAGGRLSRVVMPEETKHPAILAKDCHISDIILKHIKRWVMVVKTICYQGCIRGTGYLVPV